MERGFEGGSVSLGPGVEEGSIWGLVGGQLGQLSLEPVPVASVQI